MSLKDSVFTRALRRSAVLASLAAIALVLTACAPGPAVPADPGPITSDFQVGGDRPATVRLPSGFSEDQPTPLLLLLHGYMGSAASLESWIHLGDAAVARGMLVVAPEGTIDAGGDQFWNSSEGDCCDVYESGVDDSAYLSTLVDEISGRVSVDPARVFIFGHSNGGFMAYRMACDHADQITAIVSLAGVTVEDCSPSEPVNVLQIHGTSDRDVPYDGRRSAEGTVQLWAGFAGCDAVAETPVPPFDLEAGLAGAETSSTAYVSGCDAGGSATLWTIEGGGHLPTPSPEFTDRVLDFLESHPEASP